MPRFFTDQVTDTLAWVRGEDAHHIALALRMRTGESLTICDAKGNDFECKITNISPEEVSLRICSVSPSAGEPSTAVTLYQALPKGDKMETIVQKAVELGVAAIVPVLTERCVSRPDAKSFTKKRERYNKIALEAAKQCGRGKIPPFCELTDFSSALSHMQSSPLGIFFYENANTSLKRVLSQGVPSKVSILIGSEGGFSPAEAEQAEQAGLAALSLGSRILRCETAPLAALTAILYQAGDY